MKLAFTIYTFITCLAGFVIANKYAFPYEIALFYYTFTILSQTDALKLAPGTNMALTTWTVASAQDFMKSISEMSSTQISQMFPGMAANAAIDETTFMTQIQNYISNNNIRCRRQISVKCTQKVPKTGTPSWAV